MGAEDEGQCHYNEIQPRHVAPTHRMAVGHNLQHSALGHGVDSSFGQPQGRLTAATGAHSEH